eukprot:c45859_g1_i1 orf=89-322(-)
MRITVNQSALPMCMVYALRKVNTPPSHIPNRFKGPSFALHNSLLLLQKMTFAQSYQELYLPHQASLLSISVFAHSHT